MKIGRNDDQLFYANTIDAKFKDEVVIKYDKTLKDKIIVISNRLTKIYISLEDFKKIYELIEEEK